MVRFGYVNICREIERSSQIITTLYLQYCLVLSSNVFISNFIPIGILLMLYDWVPYLLNCHVVWCTMWYQCLPTPWRKGMFLQTVDAHLSAPRYAEYLGRWRARDHKSWHGSVSVDRQKAVVPNTRKLQDLFHESLARRSTVVTRLLLPPSVQEIHWFYFNQTVLAFWWRQRCCYMFY